jgi:hypothetical protein
MVNGYQPNSEDVEPQRESVFLKAPLAKLLSLLILTAQLFQNISMYCLLISSKRDIILGLTGWSR